MRAVFALFLVATWAHAEEGAVMGGIPKEVIDAKIKKSMPAITGCYKKAPPGSKGVVDTNFIVSAEGKVTEAKVTKSTLNSKPAEDCLIGVLKGIQFPKPEGGGIVEIDYPFSFSMKKISHD